MTSLVLVCLILPGQGVVMTIATTTTILALETSSGASMIGDRSSGALLGVFCSVGFIVLVAGAGNNLAVFLIGMAIVMGAFEWSASSTGARGAMFRQAAALFAVAATMLPRPDQFLIAATDRMLAVLFGFVVAIVFFQIPRVRDGETIRKSGQQDSTLRPPALPS